MDPARQDQQAYPTREAEAYSVSQERASAKEIRPIGIIPGNGTRVYLVSPAGPDMPVSTAEPTLVRAEQQDELRPARRDWHRRYARRGWAS